MVERHSHQVFDKVLGGFYGQVNAQDALFSWAGMLSPAIAVHVLSSSVTGTDFSHHHKFINAAEQYRRDLVNRMNADGMAHRAHAAERHVNDRRLWSQIPPFTYSEPSLGSAGRTALPALLMLLIWLVASVVFLVGVSGRLKP
jgi:ABC-2 type transport system permease protein